MGYKISTKKRIDLSELGTDGANNPFFVEIKNSKMMSYGESMAIAKLAPKSTDQLDDDAIQKLQKMAGDLVLSWNLLSIVDESPVSIPSQDPEAFNKVPIEVVTAIMKSFGEKKDMDEATKNSSVQLAKSSENVQLQETSTSEDTMK